MLEHVAELRGEKAAKKAHMENTCFICNVDRFTFDTKGNVFDAHVESEHQKWNYLFMIVHLREKEHAEYNGWEQYVAEKVRAPPHRSRAWWRVVARGGG